MSGKLIDVSKGPVPLTSIVRDKATGRVGMLTHLQIDSGGNRFYLFQPQGLDKETKEPQKISIITLDRIEMVHEAKENRVLWGDIPIEVLGTKVKDMGTGFSGTCIAVVLHCSGCIHLEIQPKTTTPSGSVVKAHEFDIRRCEGPAIPKLTKVQVAEDQKVKPSPVPTVKRELPNSDDGVSRRRFE